jgi:molybdenum cofactor biosynthesis enzyme MoaA
MHEMSELESIALLVGKGKCNANCKHCAGKIHRQYAPKKDGILDSDLIYKTLNSCYNKGARRLSISSSGEPTISPKTITKTFEIVDCLKKENKIFSDIHLYSNGIVIGENNNFCDTYLSLWKSFGLKSVYITVHDIDEKKNAEIYGIKKYPNLNIILSRIHDFGLTARANIVLSKNNISDAQKFFYLADKLSKIGFDKIVAWSIRGEFDNLDPNLAPEKSELDKMEKLIINDKNLFGKVFIHTEKDQLKYKENKKLTLFPNGVLSNTWCS